MKKTWMLALLAGMMVLNRAKANTVTLDAFSGVYPGLGGGEFTAYTSQNFLGYYAGSALYNPNTGFNANPNSANTGFETFCIETGVDFTPGNWGGPTYNYTLGYFAQPIPATGAGSAIALSKGAAYLYYQFATGQLTGFDYGSGRQADDNLLQAAIWAFQGNQTYGGYTVPTLNNNIYYKEAVDFLGGTLTDATAAYTGTSVEILQLWNGTPGVSANAAQNQLVLTGDTGFSRVPDGGLTIGLLGLAITGLSMLNRKIRC